VMPGNHSQSFDNFTGLAAETLCSKGWLGTGDEIWAAGTALVRHRLENMSITVNK